MIDHVHMCLSIPPRFSVSNVVGSIKGNSAIFIARNFKGRQRNYAVKSSGLEGILFQQ
jgi:putative transposase